VAGLSKILLVEDTPQIADIYTQVLTRQGYKLKVAGNVDELLKIVPKYKPDLIFLDIMLPGGRTGLDALKILRNDPRYGAQKTRIVLLTNLGQNDEVQKLWEKYADGYVVKAEIDPHELNEIIESFN
jgi:twitching motility two-component system response regulator PilH